jgi:ribosomal protein S18 acetylase RimI-like enzyme
VVDRDRVIALHAMVLYEVEVSDEARRSGHGRALVMAFLEEARRRSCCKVLVLADPDNDAAEALHTTTGARKTPQDIYSWDLG